MEGCSGSAAQTTWGLVQGTVFKGAEREVPCGVDGMAGQIKQRVGVGLCGGVVVFETKSPRRRSVVSENFKVSTLEAELAMDTFLRASSGPPRA